MNLTCSPHEYREWMIPIHEPRIWAFQMMWNAKFEGWECIEAGRQLRAAEETGDSNRGVRKRRRDGGQPARRQSGERYRVPEVGEGRRRHGRGV